MREKGEDEQYQKYLVNKKRDSEINQLLQETRENLEKLYKTKASKEEKRKQKKIIFSLMQKQYDRLKKSWGGYSAYDAWMKQKLNNSHLALIATYHDLVPTFKSILEKENYDLKLFYASVKKYGELDKKDRNFQLKQLAKK